MAPVTPICMTGRDALSAGCTAAQVKLHFWMNGGAQSVVVPSDQEVQRHRLLLAEGAVLLKREELPAAA
ncbi:MAG: hypothetical protein RLZZ32_2019 [Cyanobacteriota bacterium]|jgi:hypothetical protein